jgi:hypothetical protein
MTLVQRFAQVFGAIYLVVGIAGFIPPLLAAKTPDSSFVGLLLGLFFVKVREGQASKRRAALLCPYSAPQCNMSMRSR